MTEISYVKCIHFDSPRCPNQKIEIMKTAAFKVPEYTGGEVATMPTFEVDEVNKVCASCSKFESR